jgi:hypothetical protein
MSDPTNSLYNPHLGLPANHQPESLIPLNTNPNENPFGDPSNMNYFTVLFYLLLSAMQVRQSTVMTQSKNIEMNASIQNQLNNENASIKFSILTPNANNAEINAVQTKNQQYAALRENIQNSLITARQSAEVLMTQTSTNVNILQQDASENSGWLQTLSTIFQVIDEISGR